MSVRDGMQIFIIREPIWAIRGFGLNEWEIEDGKHNNRIAEITCTWVENSGEFTFPDPLYISCFRAFSYPKRPLPNDNKILVHWVPSKVCFLTRKLAERNYL